MSKLQELFSSKAVSPFVRSYGHGENEVTLLHHAIEYLQVPTAQFLMSQHLDVNALGVTYAGTPMSCLDCLGTACLRTQWSQAFEFRSPLLDMVRTILEDPDCALLIGESAYEKLEEWDGSLFLYDVNDPQGLEVDDIIQRNIFPPVKALPLSMRLRRTCHAMNSPAFYKFDISSIWDHLGQESFDEQCIALAKSPGPEYDPLNKVWYALGRAKSGGQKEASHTQVAVWREILRQLIDNGASRLILERPEAYLGQFCRSETAVSVSRAAEWFEDMVTSWFLELKLAKMDEDDMTELRQGFEQHSWGYVVNFHISEVLEDGCIIGRTRLRFTGFQHGHSSGEARIWNSPVWDETAADFWRRFEGDPTAPYEDATYHIPDQWPSQDMQRGPVDPWIEEKRLVSAMLYYSQSKRRRRRIARYYGIPRKHIDAEFGVSRDECPSGSILPGNVVSRVKWAVRQRLERIRTNCPSRFRTYGQLEVNFTDRAEQEYHEQQEDDLLCSWTIFRVWGRGELWPDDDSEND